MTLKYFGGAALVATTALAITFGATTARADFNGGGPMTKGKMCWVPTSGQDHGFWKDCPTPMKMGHMKKKKM